MQLTEEELIKIINEEVQEMIKNGDIDEGVLDRVKAGAAGLGSGLKSKVAGALGQDTTDIDTTRKLKQAASLMKSYDQQLLKLAQSLQADAAKMGIEDQTTKVQQAINQTRRQVASIARDAPTTARMQRQDRERYGDAGYSSQGQQQGQQQAAPAQQQQQAAPAQQQAAPAQQQAAPAQQQQQTATPSSLRAPDPRFSPREDPNQAVARQKIKKAVAAAPKGVRPAGPKPTEPPPRQLSQDPRNVRRREKRAAAKAAAEKDRARKDKRNAQARARRAKAKASAAALSKAPAQAAAGMNEGEVKGAETLNEQLQEISKRWGFDK